jgi:hypothetical protein
MNMANMAPFNFLRFALLNFAFLFRTDFRAATRSKISYGSLWTRKGQTDFPERRYLVINDIEKLAST